MNLNRATQLAMLSALATVYPRYTKDIVEGAPTEDDLANLWYLKEQELVEGPLDMSISQTFIFQGAKITAKGIDFLADDGGISAILGTITVRIHEDTIKELLVARIDASSAPVEKKNWLKKQIETASAEGTKKMIGVLLDQGLKYGPDVVVWVENAIQSLQKNAV